jgi:two-component system sensor histidine kinase DegS
LRRFIKQASALVAIPHFWVLVVMFIIGIFFQYPQQLLGYGSPSLLSSAGLTRHTVERILFLVPVSYAGIFLGLRAGLTSLALTLVIILPRIFLISEYRVDAMLETLVVLLLGIAVNLWFESRRKENKLYRQLIARIEESERGMTVSEQKYRYLFENASDAIWVQDVNGLFVDGNRAFEKMSGFKKEELKGVNLARFLSEESLKLAREIRNKLIKGEEFEQPYEQQFFIKDGSVKSVKMSTNAIMAGGRISGFEHVARDVTLEKQQQESVQAYIRQITRAQEEERKRIARDLHDDVSPDILILIQKLDNLISAPRPKLAAMRESLEGLRGEAVTALEALRSCAQNLRPRIIDDLGLLAALEWIAEGLEKDQGIHTRVEASGIGELTPEAQIVLFRIAQEALNNIRKHAQASLVSINVHGDNNLITMTVTDNGIGFKVPRRFEDSVKAGRLGLMGMYERSGLLNGKLSIKSTPGKGTELTVKLPRQVNGNRE